MRRGRAVPSLVIVTDPGPDPDDVKALLIAATLHNQGHLHLRAVVANGGVAARDRARLARCVLDHVGATDVPVGVGSDGLVPVVAQPHEYALAGYAAVPVAALRDDAELLLDALARAPDKSVSVVLISALTDFAALCARAPELVRRKVCTVAVQGGLVADPTSPAGWAPDTSQNNEFDRAAASLVYAFCFEHNVPMTVTSRFAVPVIPMQLARSFAERTPCPVMRYLADAQFLGLQGLWRKICAGAMPARCSKQWYFETFCGVDAAAFAVRGLEALGADTDIVAHLFGVVKPYDVLALMTVLPDARGLFPADARFAHKGTQHLLLLRPEHAIAAAPVINILREVYHSVALATAAHAARATAAGALAAPFRSRRSPAASTEGADGGTGAPALLFAHVAAAASPFPAARQSRPRGLRPDLTGALRDDGAEPARARRGKVAAGPELVALLRAALADASRQRASVRRAVQTVAAALMLASLPLVAVGARESPLERVAAAISCGALGALALVTGLDETPHGVARAEAALAALMAALALGALGAQLAAGGARLAAAPADWLLVQAAAGAAPPFRLLDAGSADARALGAAAAALSYAWLLVLGCLPLALAARAAAALGWRAARNPAETRAQLAPRWLSPAAFKRALLRWLGAVAAWLCCFAAWQLAAHGALARAAAAPPHAAPPAGALALLAVVLVVNGLAVLYCASSTVRLRLSTAAGECCRPPGYRGALASLAPLVGFGLAAAPPDPVALVREAARAFHAVALDARARARLLELAETHADGGLAGLGRGVGRVGSGGGGRAAARGPRPSGGERLAAWFTPARVTPHGVGAGAPPASSAKEPFASSGSVRGSIRPMRPSSPFSNSIAISELEPRALGGEDASARGGGGGGGGGATAGPALVAMPASRADAFVLRAPSDAPMAAELCAWAAGFEAREGRAPTVWLSELCADIALAPAELLAHSLCYLAHCDALLLLASPQTARSLHAAVVLHAWGVLGGQPADVHVALATGPPAAQTVAAFDTFHVMHATNDLDRAGSARECVALRKRLHACVRLATARALNNALRDLLPAVHAEAELRRAREAAVAALDLDAREPPPPRGVSRPRQRQQSVAVWLFPRRRGSTAAAELDDRSAGGGTHERAPASTRARMQSVTLSSIARRRTGSSGRDRTRGPAAAGRESESSECAASARADDTSAAAAAKAPQQQLRSSSAASCAPTGNAQQE